MAINSADPDVSGYTVPDNNIGWGRINDDNVCYFAGDARRLALVDNTDGLLTGEYVEYQVYVADNAIPLKAALVWTDYPAHAGRGRRAGQRPQPDRDGRNDHLQGQRLLRRPVRRRAARPTSATSRSACGGTRPTVGLWTFRVAGAERAGRPAAVRPRRHRRPRRATPAIVHSGQGQPTAARTTSVCAWWTPTPAARSRSPSRARPSRRRRRVILTGRDGVFDGTFPAPDDLPRLGRRRPLGQRRRPDHRDLQRREPGGDADRRRRWSTSRARRSPTSTPPPSARPTRRSPGRRRTPRTRGSTTAPRPRWAADDGDDGATSPSHSVVAVRPAPTRRSTTTTWSRSTIRGTACATTTAACTTPSRTDRKPGRPARHRRRHLHKKDYYQNAFARTGLDLLDLGGRPGVATPYVGDLGGGDGLVQGGRLADRASSSTRCSRTRRATRSRGSTSLGSRLAVYSQDVAWDFSDPTSPDYTAARKAWFENELHGDLAGRPDHLHPGQGISPAIRSAAPTPAGISYTPIATAAPATRSTASPAAVRFAYVWRDNVAPRRHRAAMDRQRRSRQSRSRRSGAERRTRCSSNFFEWAHLNDTVADDVVRADVLDKTLIWLVGRDHPDGRPHRTERRRESSPGARSRSRWTESAARGFSIAAPQDLLQRQQRRHLDPDHRRAGRKPLLVEHQRDPERDPVPGPDRRRGQRNAGPFGRGRDAARTSRSTAPAATRADLSVVGRVDRDRSEPDRTVRTRSPSTRRSATSTPATRTSAPRSGRGAWLRRLPGRAPR